MNKIYKEYLQNGVIDEDNAVDIIEEQKQEIERLNNILNALMQDMALLNATGIKEIKPKQVYDRIVMLRGVDKE